ncbi:MAG: hypothetical protein DRJ05_06565 [Bacteroidetes bacterium]|nr:MAG: hypothetical protein DRJ05_06565 [Bacteroidota bacterium]
MLIILVSIINPSIIAQVGFEILIDTDMRSSFSGANLDNEGNVIMVGLQYFPYESFSSEAHITKVSPFGDTTAKIVYYGEDTICGLFRVIVTKDNNYIVFGGVGKSESNHKLAKNVWVIKFDENLNTIWDKRYELPDNYWNPNFDVSMNPDSTIYLVGTMAIDGNSAGQHLFMMKFDQNGDTLKTNYPYFNNASKITYGILNMPNNNGVIVFGEQFDYGMSYMQALEIDSNLDFIVFPIDDPLETGTINATAKWFSDSTYVLSCLAVNENNGTFYNNDIEIILMGDNHEILEQHWAGRPDTNDYPAWRTSMDFIDKNNIWLSGSIQHFTTAPVDTKILVYLLDSTLNIKGAKYYGGEMNYSAYTTTATPDGGCVLGCTVYDWHNSFENDKDLWIKKVMPGDILTNAEDTPDPYDSDVLVFPTLFKDNLNIRTIRRGLSISIYGLNGIKIFDCNISPDTDSIINTTNFEKGFYIYNIMYRKKIIQTGKLIKE